MEMTREQKLQKVEELLNRAVISCNRCQDVEYPPVQGEGPLDTEVVFLGRNPGRTEHRVQRPFVGPGGELLDKELARIGVPRELVRIENMVRCYTMNDRPPNTEEIEACSVWTRAVLKAVKPKLIVALGKQAAEVFLGKVRWEDVRGKPQRVEFEWGKTIMVPATHPGQALRGHRPKLYADFNNVRTVMRNLKLSVLN